jgi:hypothetical protein
MRQLRERAPQPDQRVRQKPATLVCRLSMPWLAAAMRPRPHWCQNRAKQHVSVVAALAGNVDGSPLGGRERGPGGSFVSGSLTAFFQAACRCHCLDHFGQIRERLFIFSGECLLTRAAWIGFLQGTERARDRDRSAPMVLFADQIKFLSCLPRLTFQCGPTAEENRRKVDE